MEMERVKKCIILLLSAVLFLCFGSGKTMAADYYAGTYASGLNAYVMTETVVMGEPGFRRFDVTVKAVDNQGNLVSHLKYHFWNDPGQPVCFSNSEGYRGVVSASETPVEQNIWNIAEPISAAMWQRHLGH